MGESTHHRATVLQTEEAKVKRAKVDLQWGVHKRFKCTERDYFDDAAYAAENTPERVTCLNIDAPTKERMEIPRAKAVSQDMVCGAS